MSTHFQIDSAPFFLVRFSKGSSLVDLLGMLRTLFMNSVWRKVYVRYNLMISYHLVNSVYKCTLSFLELSIAQVVIELSYRWALTRNWFHCALKHLSSINLDRFSSDVLTGFSLKLKYVFTDSGTLVQTLHRLSVRE